MRTLSLDLCVEEPDRNDLVEWGLGETIALVVVAVGNGLDVEYEEMLRGHGSHPCISPKYDRTYAAGTGGELFSGHLSYPIQVPGRQDTPGRTRQFDTLITVPIDGIALELGPRPSDR